MPLVASLEAEGWSVWWDPDITPGEEFDSLISRELEAARSLVVVWTPTSVDSRWVRGEPWTPPIVACSCQSGSTTPAAHRLPAFHTTDLDQLGSGTAKGCPPSDAFYPALEAKLGAPTEARSAAGRDRSREFGTCALPFANMSGDPEQGGFSDGITEDIIIELGKFSATLHRLAQHGFLFQGLARAESARSGGRPRPPTRSSQRPEGRPALAHHRAAHQRCERRSRSGPSASTATSTTSSRCRTRSRRPS